jgi:hypothetical protein
MSGRVWVVEFINMDLIGHFWTPDSVHLTPKAAQWKIEVKARENSHLKHRVRAYVPERKPAERTRKERKP